MKVGIEHLSIFIKDTPASIGAVSYSRFLQLQAEVLTVLEAYLSATLGECSGLSFVDSTRLRGLRE